MEWQYRYAVDDYNDGFDDAFLLCSDFSAENVRFVAEDAGENYHYHHDGWEDSWPVKIEVWNSVGKSLGLFTVDREAVPQFSASPTVDTAEQG
jgi:hypothetical protein